MTLGSRNPGKKKKEDYSLQEINKSKESTPIIKVLGFLHREAGSPSDQTTGRTTSIETLPPLLQSFSMALLLCSNPKQIEKERRKERKEEKQKSLNQNNNSIGTNENLKKVSSEI